MRFKNIYNLKKYQINIFLMNLRDFDILISKINKKLFLNIFKQKIFYTILSNFKLLIINYKVNYLRHYGTQ
jgi:hypothetical protein